MIRIREALLARRCRLVKRSLNLERARLEIELMRTVNGA